MKTLSIGNSKGMALRIVVPEDLIMDGQCAFPVVGDVAEYALRFYHRADTEAGPGDSPDFGSVVTGEIENLDDRPVRSMLLRGAGFTAYLKSADELRGPVHLRGYFEADFAALLPESARVTGSIRRRQLITHTRHPDPDGRYRAAGTYTLSEVPDGKAGLRTGLVPAPPPVSGPFAGTGWVAMVPPRDGPWIRESGILVELDPLSPDSAGA
ncbi:hypothetical protein ACFTZB_34310 [Rhodococcus sp. NPDC057014]|uniref:hypothetical protein n=1 Tax=unclassified Rhodococcus (in: high G+C Gram-positive bacteria) TaxID=192944 RepID=UPI00363F93E0